MSIERTFPDLQSFQDQKDLVVLRAYAIASDPDVIVPAEQVGSLLHDMQALSIFASHIANDRMQELGVSSYRDDPSGSVFLPHRFHPVTTGEMTDVRESEYAKDHYVLKALRAASPLKEPVSELTGLCTKDANAWVNAQRIIRHHVFEYKGTVYHTPVFYPTLEVLNHEAVHAQNQPRVITDPELRNFLLLQVVANIGRLYTVRGDDSQEWMRYLRTVVESREYGELSVIVKGLTVRLFHGQQCLGWWGLGADELIADAEGASRTLRLMDTNEQVRSLIHNQEGEMYFRPIYVFQHGRLQILRERFAPDISEKEFLKLYVEGKLFEKLLITDGQISEKNRDDLFSDRRYNSR